MPRLVFVALFFLAALLPVWLFGLFENPAGDPAPSYVGRPSAYGHRHGGWIYRNYGGVGSLGRGGNTGGTFRGGGPHFGK